MSFTVTYKQITMPKFNQSVSKIYQENTFDDVKKAYALKRLVEKLEVEQKRFYEMYSDIQKKFVIKDEKDNEMIDPKRGDEFAKKIEELGNTEITVDWYMVSLADISEMKLTALEVAMIEPILDAASVASLQESPQS